jgi:hypothetical protein
MHRLKSNVAAWIEIMHKLTDSLFLLLILFVAWGGNYFVAGGSVKGDQILGDYPDDLTDTGRLNIGRGRLIPTTSWEATWNAMRVSLTSPPRQRCFRTLQTIPLKIFSTRTTCWYSSSSIIDCCP